MTDTRTRTVLQHLYRYASTPAARRLTDAELLQRFVNDHDQQAFTEILRRHGPLVLGVCERLLSDSWLVEDVFQATFLVLACRAGTVRCTTVLASWLYGVA